MFYLLKNGASIFKRKQENILSAAFVIAFSVALSRILGLVRYRLLASAFGEIVSLRPQFYPKQFLRF
jgi:hypothetical protein